MLGLLTLLPGLLTYIGRPLILIYLRRINREMSYRSYRHPIYKAVATPCAGGIGLSNTELYNLYNDMGELLTATRLLLNMSTAEINAIQANRPSTIATVAGQLNIPPSVYVRLAWLAANPGVRFNRANCVHVLQIAAIYDAVFAPLVDSWASDSLAARIVECKAASI